MSSSQTYEIEIRFIVDSPAEAFALLPFLEESLGGPRPWATAMIGRDVYESGRLLRLARVPPTGNTRYHLGYKEADLGTVANIRQEWGEDITDGIDRSAILAALSLAATYGSRAAILDTLRQAGYTAFMEFAGVDRLGYAVQHDLHTKLCQCTAILDDRYLIELEMNATTLEDARAAERKLLQLAETYGITDRLFRDEPPTMLYKRVFGN